MKDINFFHVLIVLIIATAFVSIMNVSRDVGVAREKTKQLCIKNPNNCKHYK